MLKQSVLSYVRCHSIRWAIISLPLWLIAFLSLFKDQAASVTGLTLYWIIHFSLIILFLAIFLSLTPSSPEKKSAQHRSEKRSFDYLVIIRCLAFANVFFGHWFYNVFKPDSLPPTTGPLTILESLLFASPSLGVWMFFTLSGYLITKGFVTERYPFSREGLLAYYQNRLIRIFPIYYTSIFIWAAINYYTPVLFPLSTATDDWLADLFFDDTESGSHIIGTLWSVSIEIQFYLFAPIFALAAMNIITKKSRGIAFCISIILLFIYLKFEMYNSRTCSTKAYFLLLPNLDCFFCGMAVACIVRLWKQQKKYIRFGFQYGIGLLLLLQPAITMWWFSLSSLPRGYYLSIAPGIIALTVGTVIFLWEAAPKSTSLAQSVFGRFTTHMATLTYCLYVVHAPVCSVLRRIYLGPVSLSEAIWLLPSGFLGTLIVASVFYYSIERPFDRLKA